MTKVSSRLHHIGMCIYHRGENDASVSTLKPCFLSPVKLGYIAVCFVCFSDSTGVSLQQLVNNSEWSKNSPAVPSSPPKKRFAKWQTRQEPKKKSLTENLCNLLPVSAVVTDRKHERGLCREMHSRHMPRSGTNPSAVVYMPGCLLVLSLGVVNTANLSIVNWPQHTTLRS